MSIRTPLRLSLGQRIDVARFTGQLPDYYEDLASLLESTKNLRQLDVFVQDAQRWAGTPRGRLSALWAERYAENGANLAQTWGGFMPERDVAVLHVQQDLGGNAITSALKDLASAARTGKELRQAAISSIGMGMVAVGVAVAAATVLPLAASSALIESFGLAPDQWGPYGRKLAAWAQNVRDWGLPLTAAIAGSLGWLVWSIDHWTGPGRAWADQHILIYKVRHEMYSMATALTLATLTRKNGSVMLTLRQSLEMLAQNAKSPWQQWQLGQTLTRISETGATDHTIFEAGLLAKEMYWRLQDLSRSAALPQALQTVADTVPRLWVPRIVRRLAVWRWILMISSFLCVGVVLIVVNTTIGELKTALMNTLST